MLTRPSAVSPSGLVCAWKSLSCVGTLCEPMEYTVRGILQARRLECIAFPFSMGFSQPRDLGLLHCRGFLYQLSRKGSPTGLIGNSVVKWLYWFVLLPGWRTRPVRSIYYWNSKLEVHPEAHFLSFFYGQLLKAGQSKQEPQGRRV